MKNISRKISIITILFLLTAWSSNVLFFQQTTNPLQNGIPFYNLYRPANLYPFQVHTMTTDTAGYLWVNSQLGLARFDGKKYDFIKTNGLPFKLLNSTQGNIFVICNNSFGKIIKNDTSFEYRTLLEFKPKNQNFCQIVEDSGKIYFHISNLYAVYNQNSKTISSQKFDDTWDTDILTKINGKIYFYKSFDGFYPVSDSNDAYISFPDEIISQTLNISRDSLFFITQKNNFYLLTNNEIQQLPDSSFKYLKGKIINGIIKTSDFAIIYTLNGGIAFVDLSQLKIVKIFNIYSGATDNQIYAMCTAQDSSVWIVNNLGFYRYDLNIPVQNFSDYVGLQGEILSVENIDSVLYVMTSNGVYYLTRPKNINEYKIITTQKVYQSSSKVPEITERQPNTPVITPTVTPDEQNEKKDTTEKKENIFKKWTKKLFGKKNKKDKNDEQPENQDIITDSVPKIITPDTTKNYTPPTKTHTKVSYKKVKIEQNKFYKYYKIYKKIKGIDAKCLFDEVIDGKIYIATDRGLYSIDKNQKSKEIIKKEFVTAMYKTAENSLIVATVQAIYEVKNDEYKILADIGNFNSYVYSIAETDGYYWFGTSGYIYRTSDFYTFESFAVDPSYLSRIKLIKIENRLYAYVPHGVYKFYAGLDRFELYKPFNSNDLLNNIFIQSQNDFIWYKTKQKWHFQTNSQFLPDSSQLFFLNLFDNIKNIKISDKNIWIVTGDNKIYRISENENIYKTEFELKLKSIVINDSSYNSTTIKIPYQENPTIEINVESNFYPDEDKTAYFYSYSQKEATPQKWNSSQEKIILPLNTGTQYIFLKAQNKLGQISNIIKIQVTVKPPFWQTDWFKLLVIFVVLIFAFFISWLRQKALKKRNEELERIVEERTKEIKQKNTELQARQEEIARQNEMLKEQRDEIQKAHDYITQSINYARRIQQAIFPSEKILLSFFEDFFILNLPKDVVSGDFYWFMQTDTKLYIAVADCTGHGVPGAFLSMLGTAYLNEMANFRTNDTAAKSLNILRKTIIYSLQEREDNDVRDGMDIGLCIIDKNTNKLNFAGAYQNLYLFRDEKMNIVKGDRMPVGFSWKNDIPFSDKWIELQKNDVIYLFTDGYADQFGGDNYEKLQSSRFRQILIKIADLPLKLQKDILVETHKEWRKDNKQTDDITVVGLKF